MAAREPRITRSSIKPGSLRAVCLVQKFIEGKNWPAVPPMGFGTVDVDDVAAAHALAAFTPKASGRYAQCPAPVLIHRLKYFIVLELLTSLQDCTSRPSSARVADTAWRLVTHIKSSRHLSVLPSRYLAAPESLWMIDIGNAIKARAAAHCAAWHRWLKN